MLTTTIFTAALALTTPASSLAEEADRAGVTTAIESMATFADRGEFDALERLFGDEVRIDYSSLSGQPAAIRSAPGLMADWAALLPGFDRTRHDLSNITVSFEGDLAQAGADVTAIHWIGDAFWQVTGDYDFTLEQQDNGWQIIALTFNLASEEGDNSLIGQAIEAAAADPHPYVLRTANQSVVRASLEALESKDMAAFNALWAEDAIQVMPYAPEGFPDRLVGRDAVIAQYAGWPELAGKADFTSQLRFHDSRDPSIVIAEFEGDVEIRPTGERYRQTYVGIYHVEEGKIASLKEFFDPAELIRAFGLESK